MLAERPIAITLLGLGLAWVMLALIQSPTNPVSQLRHSIGAELHDIVASLGEAGDTAMGVLGGKRPSGERTPRESDTGISALRPHTALDCSSSLATLPDGTRERVLDCR